jgi:transposase
MTDLAARQRAAVTAVCTDMHRPYLNAVSQALPQAEVVFDKFHVLQHASAALDEVRRQEFFRAGAVMREQGEGNAGCCCGGGKPSAGRSARNAAAEAEMGHCPSHSIVSRLGALYDRSTAVLKSVKTLKKLAVVAGAREHERGPNKKAHC